MTGHICDCPDHRAGVAPWARVTITPESADLIEKNAELRANIKALAERNAHAETFAGRLQTELDAVLAEVDDLMRFKDTCNEDRAAYMKQNNVLRDEVHATREDRNELIARYQALVEASRDVDRDVRDSGKMGLSMQRLRRALHAIAQS